MVIHPPFSIGSRLLPSLRVADGTLSLEHVRTDADGRDVFRWFIDIPAGEFSAADLRTGCQGGSYQEAFGSLLSFLGAAAESYAYALRRYKAQYDDETDNRSLFPAAVVEWAYQNSDALSMFQCEIEETEAVLIG